MDVIIPTRNSEAVLENCLKTLRAQTKPVNIIIVDAHSTDNTLAIAEEYDCMVIDEPKSNIKGSRRALACNEGLKHVTSPYVAFLDSDTEQPPTWAVDMEATMLEYSKGMAGESIGDSIPVAAITSGCEPDRSTKLAIAINNVLKIASNHARKYSEVTLVKSVPGYNAVYSVEAIKKVGGFSEEIGGCEDWELNYRLRNAGYVLLGIPRSPVIHKERATYKAFSKQMVGYGWSWSRLLKVKHIFMLSRALPALALIFGIPLFIKLLFILPIQVIEIITAVPVFICFVSLLSKLSEELLVFIVMQLSLAFGYIKGLLF